MSVVLASSILLRLAGTGYSLVLLYRSGDHRFAFLTVMLGLMASRQAWTFATAGTTGLEELPGLVVSGLAVATVHYLAAYVEEENRIKSELSSANEQLRRFRKAVEHAGHAIFLTDADGTIEYANPATEDVTGYAPAEAVGETPRLWKSGEHDEAFYAELWETITDGDVWDGEIVNRRKNGDLCWVDMTIAPITDETGAVDGFVAVDTDVTERKERELQIREQHAELEVLNTTNEVIRDVNRELLQADSKAEVEAVACERFASAGPYESAWFATRNAVTDTVRAQTSAGIDADTLSGIVDAVNDTGHETVVDRALETETTHAVRTCGEQRPACERKVCECHSYGGAAATVAIPLSYRDAHYGALVLHASDAGTPDVIDGEILDELGETIAYAITAVESQRSLVADRVTELTFEVDPTDAPLPSLAAALECDLELEQITATDDGDGDLVAFVTLRETTLEAVREYVDAVDDIGPVELVREGDSLLVRLAVSDASIIATLADYGAVVRSVTADADGGRVVADLAETGAVRSVVDAVAETHSGVTLVGQRERDRPPETHGQFRSAVDERVTGRQLEALRLAHFGGFFEWPRESSGDDLAERMGVCQSTYLQHLRAAQRKVFEAFFDADRATDSRAPAGRSADPTTQFGRS
ncbi:bacterio-opsin activator domain-containing protein [Halopiger aswanensis]|uniref:PAS domain S-box-containing protein n=1 Tax=Halopiger aswanensis TaxID=148449 RepID=A0A3R7KJ07_9EURY|nr:bacterio-opsin activator domain-containing protein [Halopiger aswanensis]RKD89050.1 PAS domain S-box-containing protein [Halopiger aswanensis]